MPIKALIFDLDGTLISSKLDLADSVNRMRQHYQVPKLPIETIGSFIGDGAKKLAERSIADQPQIDLDEALKIMLDFYGEKPYAKTTIYPGVHEVLNYAQKNKIPCAILTNKPQDKTDLIIEGLSLNSYFDHVFGPESAGGLKPKPDGILRIAELWDIPTKDILMIGDHHTDLIAAKKAGAPSCFVSYGIGHAEGCEPEYRLDEMEELTDILNS